MLCKDEAERLVSADDVDGYLAEKIEDKSFINYDVLCDRIIQSQLLLDANKSILSQTIEAINNGPYDLALVGVITVFDGVLSAATKDDSTQLITRLNKIRKSKSEPAELNRHWIALGRKISMASKLDCCKMINLLYGLIYFADVPKD